MQKKNPKKTKKPTTTKTKTHTQKKMGNKVWELDNKITKYKATIKVTG